MKISGVLLLGLSLGLGVAACGSPVHVKAAYDKKADFDGYRTFAMLLPNQPVSSGIDVDPFTMQRLRQLTYAELEARGMKAVPLEEAELIVSVLAASKEKVDVYGGGGTSGCARTDSRCSQPSNDSAASVGAKMTWAPALRNPAATAFMRGTRAPARFVVVLHG